MVQVEKPAQSNIVENAGTPPVKNGNSHADGVNGYAGKVDAHANGNGRKKEQTVFENLAAMDLRPLVFPQIFIDVGDSENMLPTASLLEADNDGGGISNNGHVAETIIPESVEILVNDSWKPTRVTKGEVLQDKEPIPKFSEDELPFVHAGDPEFPHTTHGIFEKSDLQYHTELIRRIQEDQDKGAMGEVYLQFYNRVFAYFLNHANGGVALAEDLASEVMEKVVRNIDVYKDEGNPISAWIFRIVHNHMISYWRRQSVIKKMGERVRMEEFGTLAEDSFRGDIEKVDERLDFQQVVDAVRLLSERQRNVVSLRFFKGFSLAETALRLGIDENGVKVSQHRAMKALRKRLGVPENKNGEVFSEVPPGYIDLQTSRDSLDMSMSKFQTVVRQRKLQSVRVGRKKYLLREEVEAIRAEQQFLTDEKKIE